MQTATLAQRAIDLAHHIGIVSPIDMQAIGLPRVVLSRLAATGQLVKIGRGQYRLPDSDTSETESLASIAIQAPQAVFCLLTALQFHELTTQLPRQVWIAMPRGSHTPKIDFPPIKMVQFSGAAYTEGVEVFVRDQTTLHVYNVAKTVVDCFKHRNKIGLDVALEALKEARQKNMANADDLWHYAKICRVANVMRPYLEAIG
jgi:predicted transcriptional regulator of viral defense system